MKRNGVFSRIFTALISMGIVLSLILTLSGCGFIERFEIPDSLSSLLGYFGFMPGLSNGLSDLTDYTVTDKDINTGTLILAYDDYTYDKDESWLDLVDCRSYRDEQLIAAGIDTTDKANIPYLCYRGMKLSSSAMSAAHEMLTDAKNAVGQDAIVIDGAYGMIVHSGYNVAEYNTGHLMYLSDNNSEVDARVALSEEYRAWLDKNAYKYGFIESDEDAYRYVGAPHAAIINSENNWTLWDTSTLAGYIAFLRKNTNYNNTIRITVDDVEYAIYYAACNEGDTIKAPKDLANTTISGTNEGGVIVTVKISK